MIKCPSPDNIQQIANCIDSKQAAFQTVVLGTFQEVYDNLDAIDQKVGGVYYVPETKTLVLPFGTKENKEGEG